MLRVAALATFAYLNHTLIDEYIYVKILSTNTSEAGGPSLRRLRPGQRGVLAARDFARVIVGGGVLSAGKYSRPSDDHTVVPW